MLAGAPPGTVRTAYPSGWITCEFHKIPKALNSQCKLQYWESCILAVRQPRKSHQCRLNKPVQRKWSQSVEKLKQRFRKRLQRSVKKSTTQLNSGYDVMGASVSPKTGSETSKMLAECSGATLEVQKALVLHHELVNKANNTINRASNVQQKLITSKVIHGNVLKNTG